MKTDPRPAGEKEDSKAAIDEALRQLLVGEVRIKADPATGQIVEKSPLTEDQAGHTIP